MNIRNMVCAGVLAGIVSPGALAASVEGTTVIFSDFSDANGTAALFDPASTDTAIGDQLEIALSDFAAAAGSGSAALDVNDTFSFRVTAKPGWQIRNLSYSEELSYETGPGGIAFANGSMTVSDQDGPLGAVNLATFFAPSGTSGTATSSMDFPGLGQAIPAGTTELFVFVSNALNAYNLAEIEKTAASIGVETAVVPVPPAVWLFGSAVVGLAALGRSRAARKAAAAA